MSGTWMAPPDWGSNILTSAQMDTYVTDNENYLKTHIALEEAALLTIASGVVTITQGYHKIAGEGAADDDLETISGGVEGMVIILRPSGNVITLKDGVDNLELGSDVVLLTDDYHVALICDASGNWHLFMPVAIVRTFLINAFQYPAPGTDWTPQLEGAGLAQNKTSKKIWLPLNFIKIGDSVVSYKLIGDAIEVDALTIDCKLVSVNKANPLTTTDVPGGAIVQVTADGNFDIEATLTDPEIIETDKQYILEIEGTTGTGDSIIIMGAEVLIRRLI